MDVKNFNLLILVLMLANNTNKLKLHRKFFI